MPNTVRSALLAGYEELCRSTGIDPWPLLEEAGLPTDCLRFPELRIPIDKLASLLERSAALSGIETFGLQLAHDRPLSTMGPLALLLRDQATLRAAINVFIHYRSLRSSAMLLQVEEYGDIAYLREELLISQATSSRQAVELGIGMTVRYLRLLLGFDWRPLRVAFAHRALRDDSTYARILQCPVQFDSASTGVLFRSQDLDHPLPSVDRQMARYAKIYVDSLQTGIATTILDHVRAAIVILLPTGTISIDAVAKEMKISRRVLQRRLEAEGATFSALLTDCRKERAASLLASGEYDLSNIAALIGFTHQSTFSRWFKSIFGCNPKYFRRSSVDSD